MNAFMQELIVMGIGLCAAGYLIRRWGPTLKSLWQRPTAPDAVAQATSGAPSCGTAPAQNAQGGACQSGCGQCAGAGPMPSKDHRVQFVKSSRFRA